MFFIICGIRASVNTCSIANGLPCKFLNDKSEGRSDSTSTYLIFGFLYWGICRIEFIVNFSYNDAALGTVAFVLRSEYSIPLINSSRDLPSFRLLTTGVAESPKTFEHAPNALLAACTGRGGEAPGRAPAARGAVTVVGGGPGGGAPGR